MRVGRKNVAKISTDAANAMGLTIGQLWTRELAEQVVRQAAEYSAMQDALKRLRRRLMSRRRLDSRLKLAGHEDADARAAALDRLEASGAINDAELGRALLREASRAKPAGAKLLKHKLFQAGLDASLIDTLVTEHLGEVDVDLERERTLEMLRRKARGMTRIDDTARRRRLLGLLARRGFDAGASFELVNEALGDAEQDPTFD